MTAARTPSAAALDSLLRRPRSRSALSTLARVDTLALARLAALRALPAILRQRFDPAACGDLQTVYELRVSESAGGPEARFALQVADGTLLVRPGPAHEAGAWVQIALADMIRLVSAQTSVWALMADKRLAIGGEPFVALRFPALFGLR